MGVSNLYCAVHSSPSHIDDMCYSMNCFALPLHHQAVKEIKISNVLAQAVYHNSQFAAITIIQC